MRDRDVRNAIHDQLVATGAFDGVWIWGPPEDYGTAASSLAAVAIEPESGSQEDRWDAGPNIGLEITGRVTLIFYSRNDDPQLRDEAVERLLYTAADALQGQCLAGLTVCDRTRFTSWNWQPATAPERRIVSKFTYTYLVSGWERLDDSE
jgi:hypothetical protein